MQLHRTDSGTYVCVAYNGIGGSVEREITLTVDGMLKAFTLISISFLFVCDKVQLAKEQSKSQLNSTSTFGVGFLTTFLFFSFDFCTFYFVMVLSFLFASKTRSIL